MSDTTGLPRPLRDADLLQLIREADRLYLMEKTSGPILIELHYDEGTPRKFKVKAERSGALKVPAA